MTMKINFSQLYAEVGVSFSPPIEVLRVLNKKVNSLNKEIPFFKKKFNDEDFTLGIVISATRKNDVFEVKGPTYFKKSKTVDFVLFIPYQDNITMAEEVPYILSHVGEGLAQIFEKYKADGSGIRESIQSVIDFAA